MLADGGELLLFGWLPLAVALAGVVVSMTWAYRYPGVGQCVLACVAFFSALCALRGLVSIVAHPTGWPTVTPHLFLLACLILWACQAALVAKDH